MLWILLIIGLAGLIVGGIIADRHDSGTVSIMIMKEKLQLLMIVLTAQLLEDQHESQ